MGEEKNKGSIGLATCANPRQAKPTTITIEEIDNGYIICPTNFYFGTSKKVYIQELSQLPNELALMFSGDNPNPGE